MPLFDKTLLYFKVASVIITKCSLIIVTVNRNLSCLNEKGKPNLSLSHGHETRISFRFYTFKSSTF
jgi:hypothetical protein